MADLVIALDWVVLCSNPAEATYFASELWQFRLLRFASLSEETLEAVCLASNWILVHNQGSKFDLSISPGQVDFPPDN